MWFITAISSYKDRLENPMSLVGAQRTFGYFSERSKAVAAIASNEGNMHECLYNYLVLEYIEEGIHALAEEERTEWFVWDVSGDKDKWIPGEPPEAFKGIINWALG